MTDFGEFVSWEKIDSVLVARIGGSRHRHAGYPGDPAPEEAQKTFLLDWIAGCPQCKQIMNEMIKKELLFFRTGDEHSNFKEIGTLAFSLKKSTPRREA